MQAAGTPLERRQLRTGETRRAANLLWLLGCHPRVSVRTLRLDSQPCLSGSLTYMSSHVTMGSMSVTEHTFSFMLRNSGQVLDEVRLIRRLTSSLQAHECAHVLRRV